MNKNKKYEQLIDEIILWSSIANPDDIDEWLNYCQKYLEHYKWNNKAIKDFLNWGKDGYNNNNLNFQSNNKSFYEEIESFYEEVEYCSDRMTLDRLFRCHTYYWNLKYLNLNKD